MPLLLAADHRHRLPIAVVGMTEEKTIADG